VKRPSVSPSYVRNISGVAKTLSARQAKSATRAIYKLFDSHKGSTKFNQKEYGLFATQYDSLISAEIFKYYNFIHFYENLAKAQSESLAISFHRCSILREFIRQTIMS